MRAARGDYARGGISEWRFALTRHTPRAGMMAHYTRFLGNALAAAVAALRPRFQMSDADGGRPKAETVDDVYAMLEDAAQEISVDAAISLGGGGRIAMPVSEREARRKARDGDADAHTLHAGGGLELPRTIQDICSDSSIPPSLV
jgi:hypothetical protein